MRSKQKVYEIKTTERMSERANEKQKHFENKQMRFALQSMPFGISFHFFFSFPTGAQITKQRAHKNK